MLVVTLISARHSLPIARDVAESLGGALTWLQPDVACDIHLPEAPTAAAMAEVRALAAATKVDCVVQEAAGRRKQILIADMDSTMIGKSASTSSQPSLG